MKWARPGLWTHRSTSPVVRLLARPVTCYRLLSQRRAFLFIEFSYKFLPTQQEQRPTLRKQLCFRDNVFCCWVINFEKICRFLILHHAPIISTFRHTDTTHKIVILLLEITPKRFMYDRLYYWAVSPDPTLFLRQGLTLTGLASDLLCSWGCSRISHLPASSFRVLGSKCILLQPVLCGAGDWQALYQLSYRAFFVIWGSEN